MPPSALVDVELLRTERLHGRQRSVAGDEHAVGGNGVEDQPPLTARVPKDHALAILTVVRRDSSGVASVSVSLRSRPTV